MRRHPTLGGRLAVVLVVAVGYGLGLREGLIPPKFSPLPRLRIAAPPTLVVDWQLSEIAADRELCRTAVDVPQLAVEPVPDIAVEAGCGLQNGVKVGALADARLTTDRLTCGMAAALGLWLLHDVQPLAEAMLGARVRAVNHMGTFACRNIIGSRLLSGVRSQHARANAIDISGFTLTDGRRVTVKAAWGRGGPEAEFLREAHRRSCRYFRAALGPNFNAAHHDHFHFDRGPLHHCR